MDNERPEGTFDSMTLRFMGDDKEGHDLHELRALHVSEVLAGLAEFTKDLDKSGVFHDSDSVGESVIYVKPAQEGSFLIEVIRTVADTIESYPVTSTTVPPTLAGAFAVAAKYFRTPVKDYEHLDNGNVKIIWKDKTVREVSRENWEALNKSPRLTKKRLRQIMKPLDDERVVELEVAVPAEEKDNADEDHTPTVVASLDKEDFEAVYPTDDIEEFQEFFEGEAQMSAIDFDNPEQWKVKVGGKTRKATVEDDGFLKRVAGGLPISRDDIFWVRIREDRIKKNGRNSTSWTVLSVEHHRRNRGDNDSATRAPAEA